MIEFTEAITVKLEYRTELGYAFLHCGVATPAEHVRSSPEFGEICVTDSNSVIFRERTQTWTRRL